MSSLLTKLRSFRLSYFLLACLAFAACKTEGQMTGFFKEAFSVTPRCGVTEKLITFQNNLGEPLEILGIAIAPGTNGAGHFSIQGLTIGSEEEIPRDVSGGIDKQTIPAGENYSLRVRYSPFEESGEQLHSAVIDFAYSAPKQGVVQVEVTGRSEGEADCPEIATGGATGLDGPVEVTLTFMVAASSAIPAPLTTDNGVEPFQPVTLAANISGNTFDFPQITLEDQFFLPEPDPKVPGIARLLDVVTGDTDVTTATPIQGFFDASSGKLVLPDISIKLEDEAALLNLFMTFTTDPVDPGNVPQDRIELGEFAFPTSDGKIPGLPVQEDGKVHLVGATTITEATGNYGNGIGTDILIRIEAQILCAGEDDAICDGE